MKNISKIELKAEVIDGRIQYRDIDYTKKIHKFKEQNEGEKINVTIEKYETPEYFQHKYYRGYLLPDVAKAYGERDTEYVHRFELKKDFALIPVDSAEDIPQKYKSKCVVYVQDVEIDGEIKTRVAGYSKSCADMTYDEMKEYILKVEHRLFVDLSGHIGMDRSGDDLQQYQNEAKLMRADAMSGQHEIFADEAETELFADTEKDLFDG